MKSLNTDAVVLRSRDFQDTHRIVTFITRDHGRITTMARHARHSKKRFANCLESCSIVKITFTPKANKTLWHLDHGILCKDPTSVRSNIDIFTTHCLICEIMDLMCPLAEPTPGLYELIENSFNQLTKNNPLLVEHFIVFLTRFLGIMGYAPQLSHCFKCHTPLSSHATWLFSPDNGSIVCHACSHKIYSKLNKACTGTIKSLIAIQQLQLSRAFALRWRLETKIEAIEILIDFLVQRLTIKPKSLPMFYDFLKKTS